MPNASTARHLEELQLIQCSLLPTEHLTFLENADVWEDALLKHSEGVLPGSHLPPSFPSIGINVDGAKVWFGITTNEEASGTIVSVRGEGIKRKEQERWQSLVVEKMEEISDSEYPLYQLVSLHLLPLLHDEIDKEQSNESTTKPTSSPDIGDIGLLYHVLFTSHHLISPNKRRSLQQWSSSLSLSGFAKVGYPGVIYAQGERTDVEEFVANVKAMQWLALKVRFVEPLPTLGTVTTSGTEPQTWKEFQKVGEVVEEMRRIGKEEYVVEMGIGSAGVNNVN